MKLITKEIEKILPPLYSTEEVEDKLAVAKFFTPWSNITWYVVEGDVSEGLLFGLVEGFEKELGYFTLEELENLRGPMGLKVERDTSFEPTLLSKL